MKTAISISRSRVISLALEFCLRQRQQETLLEQLRLRQLSIEQLETYERQRAAADKLRTLNEAQAQAAVQVQLTNAKADVQIAESRGEAELARARKQSEQMVVIAEAELARSRRQAEQTVLTAEAQAKEKDAIARVVTSVPESAGEAWPIASRTLFLEQLPCARGH